MKLITNAHIAVPSEAMPVISELIVRLGGEIIANDNDQIFAPVVAERVRIGKMLKGLRLRAEMTQKELADAIGVPQGHISGYESNKRPIPSSKLDSLAKVLNMADDHFVQK